MIPYTKKQWSSEEEMEMLSSIRRGENFETIAQKHDRTQNAIRLRFGMVCKKELASKTIQDLCKEYKINENLLRCCIQDLENIQKKKQPTTMTASSLSSFDPADISIMKEEILVLNEKLDKIHKYLKKIMEILMKKKLS